MCVGYKASVRGIPKRRIYLLPFSGGIVSLTTVTRGDSGLPGPISVYHAGLSAIRILFTQIYRSVYSRFDITGAALRFVFEASALCRIPSRRDKEKK